MCYVHLQAQVALSGSQRSSQGVAKIQARPEGVRIVLDYQVALTRFGLGGDNCQNSLVEAGAYSPRKR